MFEFKPDGWYHDGEKIKTPATIELSEAILQTRLNCYHANTIEVRIHKHRKRGEIETGTCTASSIDLKKWMQKAQHHANALDTKVVIRFKPRVGTPAAFMVSPIRKGCLIPNTPK